jgi:hypothetical protein
MDFIKRKILLENYIDRRDFSDNYGSITATTFSFNIFINQSFDDMGLFTDEVYEKAKLQSLFSNFDFVTRSINANNSDFYSKNNSVINYITDSKIELVTSYDENSKYQPNVNITSEQYQTFDGNLIDGVNKVISTTPNIIYTIDANNFDPLIGTTGQTYGILYSDISGSTNFLNNTITNIIYSGQGFNQTNSELSALTKEEYLFGITAQPEVNSDVFIDRGKINVFEPHIRLSEINSLNDLVRYNGEYYNIFKF